MRLIRKTYFSSHTIFIFLFFIHRSLEINIIWNFIRKHNTLCFLNPLSDYFHLLVKTFIYIYIRLLGFCYLKK